MSSVFHQCTLFSLNYSLSSFYNVSSISLSLLPILISLNWNCLNRYKKEKRIIGRKKKKKEKKKKKKSSFTLGSFYLWHLFLFWVLFFPTANFCQLRIFSPMKLFHFSIWDLIPPKPFFHLNLVWDTSTLIYLKDKEKKVCFLSLNVLAFINSTPWKKLNFLA